jgi:hypothetical protein
MKKAVLVLTLAISLTGLKADESQVPFKVGDVVALIPLDTGTEKKPCRMVIVVEEIKGKWVRSATVQLPQRPRSLSSSTNSNSINISMGEHWYNTEAYSQVWVNDPEIVKMIREGITPEGWTRPPIIHTNPVTKRTALQPPVEVEEEPKVEGESK